jgi:2-polyprenyl-3-methyl-5-hydroxy-6-metoxy-1,4-benzoquinol methylase
VETENPELVSKKKNFWGEKQAKFAVDNWRMPNYVRVQFDMISKRSNQYIDLGCGYGRLSDHIKKHKKWFAYTGYDSSQAMINLAKERNPENEDCFIIKDITKNQWDISSDMIICNAVLIHLNLDDCYKVFNKVREVQPNLFVFDMELGDTCSFKWVPRKIGGNYGKNVITYEVLDVIYSTKFKNYFRETYDYGKRVYTWLRKK